MLRQYHGGWARFDQPDPYDGSYLLADPQSLNRYGYTQDDPVNFTDPSGLFALGPGKPPAKPLDPSQCYTLVVDGVEAGQFGNCGGGGFGGGGGQGGGGGGNTGDDVKDHIFNNAELLAKMNECLSKVFKAEGAAQIGTLSRENSPGINVSMKSEEIQKKFNVGVRVGDVFKPIMPYAVGIVGQRDAGFFSNTTVYYATNALARPNEWTLGGRTDLPGRTGVQNGYVHEVGNIISHRLSGNYFTYGIKGASDEDSGYAFQVCVFGAKNL
jgi:hypothetical protein